MPALRQPLVYARHSQFPGAGQPYRVQVVLRLRRVDADRAALQRARVQITPEDEEQPRRGRRRDARQEAGRRPARRRETGPSLAGGVEGVEVVERPCVCVCARAGEWGGD